MIELSTEGPRALILVDMMRAAMDEEEGEELESDKDDDDDPKRTHDI